MGKRKAESDGGISNDRMDQILGLMLKRKMEEEDTILYQEVRDTFGFAPKNKHWDACWKALREEGLIEACNGGAATSDRHRLTEAGLARVKTPEFEAYMREMAIVPQSNEEHQARLKKRFKNKYGEKIFGFLVEWGSLSKKELAALCGVREGSHGFFYGHQQLVKMKLIEADPTSPKGKAKKLRLADAAFLKSHNRPVPIKTDTKKLAEVVERDESGRKSKDKAKTEAQEAKERAKQAKAEANEAKAKAKAEAQEAKAAAKQAKDEEKEAKVKAKTEAREAKAAAREAKAAAKEAKAHVKALAEEAKASAKEGQAESKEAKTMKREELQDAASKVTGNKKIKIEDF